MYHVCIYVSVLKRPSVVPGVGSLVIVYCRVKLGTCEALRFEFESDVPIRFESDGPILKFRIVAPATFAVVP